MPPHVCGGMGLGSAGLPPPQLLVIVLDPSGVQLLCLWCSVFCGAVQEGYFSLMKHIMLPYVFI